MELTLIEAVNHAKQIKKLDCKICGKTIENSIELIAAIRNNGHCSYCRYLEQHNYIFNPDEFYK